MAENKWVTGVIIPISEVITILKTDRGPSGRGPPCSYHQDSFIYMFSFGNRSKLSFKPLDFFGVVGGVDARLGPLETKIHLPSPKLT